jgi:hypothetical protein
MVAIEKMCALPATGQFLEFGFNFVDGERRNDHNTNRTAKSHNLLDCDGSIPCRELDVLAE